MHQAALPDRHLEGAQKHTERHSGFGGCNEKQHQYKEYDCRLPQVFAVVSSIPFVVPKRCKICPCWDPTPQVLTQTLAESDVQRHVDGHAACGRPCGLEPRPRRVGCTGRICRGHRANTHGLLRVEEQKEDKIDWGPVDRFIDEVLYHSR